MGGARGEGARARGQLIGFVVSLAIAALLAGCGGAKRDAEPAAALANEPWALDVDVRADTGAGGVLRVDPPIARVWVESVRGEQPKPIPPATLPPPPIPPAPAPPLVTGAALPDAAPDTLAPEWPAAPALAMDQDLKPPVPRHRAQLIVPSLRPRHPTVVELDVLVDDRGSVAEAAWAGGENDSALVKAAIACAREMDFYPALKGGTPVAVWCRQRFDFGRR